MFKLNRKQAEACRLDDALACAREDNRSAAEMLMEEMGKLLGGSHQESAPVLKAIEGGRRSKPKRH